MINRFEIIREHYNSFAPMIFAAAKDRVRGWASPYSRQIDWQSVFSPIEDYAWQAIRCFGRAPFYPQYPVAGYFIDFGNPVVKVGIECDGQEFHTDKVKDLKRDKVLLSHGWRIFRIPGSDCVRPVPEQYYELGHYDPWQQEEILQKFYRGTIEGLLKAIAIRYFDYKTFYDEPDEYAIAMECLDIRISIKEASPVPNPYFNLVKL